MQATTSSLFACMLCSAGLNQRGRCSSPSCCSLRSGTKYPGPNLVPTYAGHRGGMRNWVRKPIFRREGDGGEITPPDTTSSSSLKTTISSPALPKANSSTRVHSGTALRRDYQSGQPPHPRRVGGRRTTVVWASVNQTARSPTTVPLAPHLVDLNDSTGMGSTPPTPHRKLRIAPED